MNVNSQDECLVDFDGIESVNRLLSHIGMEPDLGSILIEHLPQVLRKQHPSLDLISIRLMSVEKCVASGQMPPDQTIAEIDSLAIPVRVEATVVNAKKRYRLDLDITIRAESAATEYEFNSDLVVHGQEEVN